MLDLIDVDLTYSANSPTEVRAISDLSLHVNRGEFVTVVGSNGAGKSSTIQVIAGAVRPTRGRVLILLPIILTRACTPVYAPATQGTLKATLFSRLIHSPG